jgi:hypothetical protein
VAQDFGGIYSIKSKYTEIRVRTDIGIVRGESISDRLKQLLKNAEEFRPVINKRIIPDIWVNNKAVFDNQGVNAYGDGELWPPNSRFWAWFKREHEGETVKNPFTGKGLPSHFEGVPFSDMIKIKYSKTAMLTGRLYNALTAKNNNKDFWIDAQSGKNNFYLRCAVPYLDDLQEGRLSNTRFIPPRKVLFIGKRQKEQWLEWIKEHLLSKGRRID